MPTFVNAQRISDSDLKKTPLENSKRSMEVEDLFRFRRIADVDVSPDGRWVAYQVTDVDLEKNATRTCIYLASTDGSLSPRAITNSGKKDSRPRFSPNSKTILFQSNRSGSMQIWSIELDGGEARQLTTLSTEATQATWAPDGRSIAFASSVFPQFSELPFAESEAANKKLLDQIANRNVSVRVFDRLFYRHWDSYVEGKRQHLFVLQLKANSLGLEPAGSPRDVTPGDRDAVPTSSTFSSSQDYCFSKDGTGLIFTAPPVKNEAWSTDYELCRVPTENQSTTWQSLTSGNPAADSGPRISPNGKFIAWRSQTIAGSEADRWQLRVSPIKADGTLQRVTSSTENREGVSLTAELDSSVNDFVWTSDTELMFVSDRIGEHELWQVNVDTKLAPRKTDIRSERYSGGVVMSMSSAAGQMAFVSSRMDQPPEVFLRSGNKSVANLSQANTELSSQIAWASQESVKTIPIEGNRQMQMWILKPPGFDPNKKYPVVYLVHGGPQGAWENGWSYRWCPQAWAAKGYVVALPNPRGSTGFGQKFVEEISGDWGGKCYRDLMAGVDYLETLPYVDSDRIAAAGASFGGYMMNWFAVSTNRFKCLITHCSVWNFESMWGTTDELWFDEHEHGGLPWEHPERYREYSPHVKAGELGKFKTPMLVIHNDFDFRCPIGQGHELFSALQRQGVPSRFVNFSNEGHWVVQPANSQRWHQEVFGWLDKYCPAHFTEPLSASSGFPPLILQSR